MMNIDTPPASDDENNQNDSNNNTERTLPVVSNSMSNHGGATSFNSPPAGFGNTPNSAAALFTEKIQKRHDTTTSPMRNTKQTSRGGGGGSYMDSESSLSTTDDLDDFHKVQLDTLTQENDAKQAALEEMTHRYHKLHDRSMNYEQNIRDRDTLIAQLSKELTSTKDKIMKVKKQLKDRGLNSMTGSEMGDTLSMDGRLRLNQMSGRQSAMSEFEDLNYTKLQSRLQFSEEQLVRQTAILEKIKADLGLPQGVEVNEVSNKKIKLNRIELSILIQFTRISKKCTILSMHHT